VLVSMYESGEIALGIRERVLCFPQGQLAAARF